MQLQDIRNRIERLAKLSLGSGRELSLWRKGGDKLLFYEREEYLKAIGDAMSNVEEARIALVKAEIRLGEAG